MKVETKYPHIFEPINLGPVRLKNRLMFTPMVCCLSSADGEVTREYVEFIGAQARTGVALVTIGATGVNEETAVDVPGELDITTDKKLGGLLRLSEEVHRYGAKLSIELCHAGRGAFPALLKTPYALAPSAIPTPVGTKYIKEMDQKDIDQVIADYVDCAVRLKKARFDMVMIHAAHGNLIGQFLSPLTNKRTDCYGGSLENRMRFPLELLRAVREAVGDQFGMDMRISGDEIAPDGMKLEEVIVFLKEAQKYLNTVQISQGIIIDPRYAYHVVPPYYYDHCHNVKYAKKVKKALDIPVSTFGSVTAMEEAEQILASGDADCVGMARPLLADHDLVNHARKGQEENTRPCLRCLECLTNAGIGEAVRCAVNPVTGREDRYKEIQPAKTKKKIMIVGGGPAGMMAAQTACERGHEVVLYEKSDHLGGLLPDISSLPFKGDMRRYLKWDIQTTENCGAKVVLETEVTPEIVEKENPDALFLAVGSSPVIPPIPGIEEDYVKHVLEVDSGRADTGRKVVVCGGGISGLECALGLAMDGKEVTVVDIVPADQFGADMAPIARMMLMDLLNQYHVRMEGGQKVQEFTQTGVKTMDSRWNVHIWECDTAVTAFGMKPNNTKALENLVWDTYVIGDCYQVRNIFHSNHMAFNYAVEV